MAVADILLRITSRRRERLGSAAPLPDGRRPDGKSLKPLLEGHPFLAALAENRGQAIIAEVKMGSPKLGNLNGRVDPISQARLYADNGAAALSVVVEPDFFFGSYELLAACKAACGLPAVAKDFLVHPVQIDRAQAVGADSILLIAALYERDELLAWADLARSRGLVPLVETHSAEDLDKLEGRNWELVGVNNRDLRTFKVDLEHSIEQVQRLPSNAFKVAESGIRSGEDVSRLAAAGFDAFLIGETLLLAEDPGKMLRELTGEGPGVSRSEQK
jgi:indole-3-glycerol phosphate synthase